MLCSQMVHETPVVRHELHIIRSQSTSVARSDDSHCSACAGYLSVIKIMNVQLDDNSITCLLRPLTHCNRTIRELNLAGSLKTITDLGYASLSQMLLTNDALLRVYIDGFIPELLDGMAMACDSKYGDNASATLPRISAALHLETLPFGGMIRLPVGKDATAAAAAVLISCTASLCGMYCDVSMVSSLSRGYAWLLLANAQRPNNVTIYFKSLRTTDETVESAKRWCFTIVCLYLHQYVHSICRAGCNCAIGPPLLANEIQIPLNVSSVSPLLSSYIFAELSLAGFATRRCHPFHLQCSRRHKWTF